VTTSNIRVFLLVGCDKVHPKRTGSAEPVYARLIRLHGAARSRQPHVRYAGLIEYLFCYDFAVKMVKGRTSKRIDETVTQ
jgi:hypothetical protein